MSDRTDDVFIGPPPPPPPTHRHELVEAIVNHIIRTRRIHNPIDGSMIDARTIEAYIDTQIDGDLGMMRDYVEPMVQGFMLDLMGFLDVLAQES
jgi:hypothetical protein